jgi:aryl-alcohol dehydrogenase-like predicted oxidoreductase
MRERLAAFDTPRNWRILEALKGVAREVERPPSQVALAWLVARPAVTSVIFGARSLAQLEDNLGAVTLQLSAEQRRALDEASAFELGYPYDLLRRVQGGW